MSLRLLCKSAYSINTTWPPATRDRDVVYSQLLSVELCSVQRLISAELLGERRRRSPSRNKLTPQPPLLRNGHRQRHPNRRSCHETPDRLCFACITDTAAVGIVASMSSAHSLSDAWEFSPIAAVTDMANGMVRILHLREVRYTRTNDAPAQRRYTAAQMEPASSCSLAWPPCRMPNAVMANAQQASCAVPANECTQALRVRGRPTQPRSI